MSNNTTLPGTGEVVEDIDIGGGVKRQVITIGDRGGNAVDVIGGLTETAPASDTASSGLNGRLQRIAQRVTSLIALVPTALGQTTKSASLAVTVASDDDLQGKLGALTETAPASDTASAGHNGRLQRIAQNLTTLLNALTGTAASGLYNKCFAVAFTTLTRPANVTAYTAGDSISNNATAGSVTALSATVADANNAPLFLADILIVTTDTGLAGLKLRANVFNSDPTASSGVGAGDNVAYSQKKAGYIGTFVGTLETGFSDGVVGRLVPSFRDTNYTPAGGFVITPPSSGGTTLYIQFVAEVGFTPSANSTTIIATIRGWQARAS